MKLVSLNMEGLKHLDLVRKLLIKEKPEFLCLQEAPENFALFLEANGFTTYFQPVTIKVNSGKEYTEGIMSASIHPVKFDGYYYHRPAKEMVLEIETDIEGTNANSYIIANISHPTEGNTIVINTHFGKSYDGLENEHQKKCFVQLENKLNTEQPHIICGDFNMPRGYNKLYEEMIKVYKDEIPTKHKSSLDRDLHQLGPIADQLDRRIFENYMVDYIFSKPEYRVENVRLQFGVSDHAAVVADVYKK